MSEKHSADSTVEGTIEGIVYYNEMSDYAVLEVLDEKNTLITAVGTIPMPSEGEKIVLHGYWTYHAEYGKQLAVLSFEKGLPEAVDDILKYLSSRTVKGVGPVTALKIVNRFGIDTFEVMENHPEWLSDISGITPKKAAAISKAFREQTGLRSLMMFCGDRLGTSEVTRIYKQLGGDSVNKITDNPYILCDETCGIPFEKADEIARSLGITPDHPERLFFGLCYILNYNARVNGHTCLPFEKLIAAATETLGLPAEVIGEHLTRFLREGRLCRFSLSEREMIMTREVDEEETYIVKKLLALDRDCPKYSATDISLLVEKAEGRIGIEYAALQRQALYESLHRGVMILTGGPGTGKTTVIRAMLSVFDFLGMKTVLAAPTGRAAKRMSEATSEEAKTVHRMLGMERGTDGSARFDRCEKNPLEENVIIVDEASMIDLGLMAALLHAIRRGSRLILIGDSDQLPSVGAGNVLADLIASECVSTVSLTEVFRQSAESLIVTNAHRICHGELPVLSRTDADFFFVRREDERTIPDTVAQLITNRLPRTYGEEIRDKIQVISPSKKGTGGVEVLNLRLQEMLNPPATFKKEKQSHGTTFRVGDRVMQNTNDYEVEWEKNGVAGTGIFNGDIGVIEEILPSEEKMRIRFDDRLAEYSYDLLDELDLAYAITVHKSQGSEYPVVILPTYACAPMLLTRNLFYTAITRAKRMVILVGRADIVRVMVENHREILRYTTLRERFSEETR